MKTDSELQKDVMEELKWHPSVKSSHIGVAVANGIVTLSGTVESYAEKRAAEKAAMSVSGVKAIAEELEVVIDPNHKKNDAEIAQASLNALTWDTFVPNEKIKLKVENGWVTTEGVVDWEFQQRAVRNAISNIKGVRGITNLVTISPKVNSADIQRDIIAAFKRSASIDADNVFVENQGNHVTLKGTVRSYAEKLDAERTAWNAPGVTTVLNKLEVKVPSFSSM